MKILVFSDSHGITGGMEKAVATEKDFQYIIHLGDGEKDLKNIIKNYPKVSVVQVAGNCDYNSTLNKSERLYIDGKMIYITHGDLYGVKLGLGRLAVAARKKGADLVLFGHTHSATIINEDGMILMNPGSMAVGYTYYPSYGVVTFNEKGMDVEIKQLED